MYIEPGVYSELTPRLTRRRQTNKGKNRTQAAPLVLSVSSHTPAENQPASCEPPPATRGDSKCTPNSIKDSSNVRKSANEDQNATKPVPIENIQTPKVITQVEPTASGAIGDNTPVTKDCSVQIERLDYIPAREIKKLNKG